MKSEPVELRSIDRTGGGSLTLVLDVAGGRTVEVATTDPPGSVVLRPKEFLDVARVLLSLIRGFGSAPPKKRGRPKAEPTPKAEKRAGTFCRRHHDLTLPGAVWVNPKTHFRTCHACVRYVRAARRAKAPTSEEAR